MNKIKKGFVDYRMNGGTAVFNEWFDALMEKAYELDEMAVYNELNEDFDNLDQYYTELCEGLLKKDKRLDSDALKLKYNEYVKKRKKEGKDFLPFKRWCERQETAHDLKKTLGKAGITLAGITAVKAGTTVIDAADKKVRKKNKLENGPKEVRHEVRVGNKINLKRTSKY